MIVTMSSVLMRTSKQTGFTLVEILFITAIMGILVARASYSATVEQKRAKRTEVIYGLDALEDAQRLYYEEYNRYADNFESLTFAIDGAVMLSPTTLRARRYTYSISQPWGEESYFVTATGQLDSDPFPGFPCRCPTP